MHRLPLIAAVLATSCLGRGGFDAVRGSPTAANAPTVLTYRYPLTTYGAGLPIFPNLPTTDGTGLTWSVMPELPEGLTLASDTGIIDGTPAFIAAYADYTITAQNERGSLSTTVRFRVLASGFEATNTADQPDANPGDGTCADAAGHCTVRAALEEAGASDIDRVVQIPDGLYRVASAIELLNGGPVYAVIGESAEGTVVDGGSTTRILYLGSIDVEVGYLTLQNGSTSDGGAIIAEADAATFLHHCALLDNTVTGYGGAVYVTQGAALPGGQLRMDSCRVERNSADVAGGAIVLWGFGETTADLLRSSFIDNTAGDYAGVIATFSGVVTIDACLFDGNRALTGSGGVRAEPGRTLVMTNSTVVNNSGTWGAALTGVGGDAFFHNTFAGNSGGAALHGAAIGDPVTLGNNLFVDNDGNCVAVDPEKYDSRGGNISDDDTCGVPGTSDRMSQAAAVIALGPLEDHGGPTSTMLPGTGSIAIDAGIASSCTTLDQRGLPRPADGDGDGAAACDVGAVELQ